MTDLIARLEAAEAGSRELDCRVVAWSEGVIDGEHWSDADLEYALTDPDRTCNPPRYSTSLDAALALASRVLPGGEGEIDFGRRGFACLHPEQPYPAHLEYNAEASTPALALCAAILRAKSEGRA